MSQSGAVDGDDLQVVAGFAAITARYSDDQLQAYIAIRREFSRAALDLTRSITNRPDRNS